MDAIDDIRFKIIKLSFTTDEDRPNFRKKVKKLYGEIGNTQLSYMWNNGILAVSVWGIVSLTKKGLILEQELRGKDSGRVGE